MNDKKIFCVGFQKTGTTSFSAACKALGFKCQSTWVLVQELSFEEPQIREIILEKIKHTMTDFDVLEDAPVNFFFKELDSIYQNSKFVLTIRDEVKWFQSLGNYFNTVSPARKWMYGINDLNEKDLILDVYRTQNKKIIDHFKSRPEKLLVMDLSKGDGWYELVNFLGKDYLPGFPHKNKATPNKGISHQSEHLFKKIKARLFNH